METAPAFDAVVYAARTCSSGSDPLDPISGCPVGVTKVTGRSMWLLPQSIPGVKVSLAQTRRALALQLSLQIHDLEARAVRMRDLMGACACRSDFPGVTQFADKHAALKREADEVRSQLRPLWVEIEADEKSLGVAS